MMSTQRKESAFTLIELLVVIAIIAILAAILFPVFARARENARRASCMSNLKQMSLGMMMYVQDYDEKFSPLAWPSGSPEVTCPDGVTTTCPLSWPVRIYPYVKSVQVFNCPSDTKSWKGNDSGTTLISIGYNDSIASQAMAAIQKPAETLLLADAQGQAPYDLKTTYYTGPSSTRGMSDRHLNGGNIAFADGHVKWISIPEDSSGNPIHPDYKRGIYWLPSGTS